jgi:hypothetical protein
VVALSLHVVELLDRMKTILSFCTASCLLCISFATSRMPCREFPKGMDRIMVLGSDASEETPIGCR